MEIETIVETIVEEAIRSYLDRKTSPKTKHVILDEIFPVERRIRSIVGGLEGSIGTKIWEKLSYIFANKSGFNIQKPKEFYKPKKLPNRISDFLAKVDNERKDNPDQTNFNKILTELREMCLQESSDAIEFVSTSSGDGIDMWFMKDGRHYIFDTKTVQINSSNANNFANKVLHWYSYFWLRYPNEDVTVGIVFPYSPYGPTFDSDSWWQNNGGRAKPLQREMDAFVQDEFWDLITGTKDSWKRIKTGIKRVGSRNLAEKYSELFYGE